MTKADIGGLALLCALAVLTGAVVNALSPAGIAWIGDWDKSQGVVSAQAKDAGVDHRLEINDPVKMKQMVDAGNHLIFDVRPAENYQNGHIPGAVSMPLDAFDRIIGPMFETTPPDTAIILYCSSRECDMSHTFARRLKEMGYTNLNVYSGGMQEWEEAGFAIARE